MRFDKVHRIIGLFVNHATFSDQDLQELRKQKESCQMVKTAIVVITAAVATFTLLSFSKLSLILGGISAVCLMDAHTIADNFEQCCDNPAYAFSKIPFHITLLKDYETATKYILGKNTIFLGQFL